MSSRTVWEKGCSASLFERIQGASHQPVPLDDATQLIESVKRQLDQILNTRPGSCRSAPVLGVADFNDAVPGSRDVHSRIRHAIRHCIDQFEPRIVRVEVSSPNEQTHPLDMVFQVTAHLRFEQLEQVTAFNLQMDNHRRYRMV